LITERAALFHLANGFDQAGRELLGEAKRQYAAWCATAKVRQLDEEHAFLGAATARQHRVGISHVPASASSGISADEIDMLAVLRTSQALSSETSLDQLRARVGELLSAMTGATKVLIVQRPDESADWMLWDTTGGSADGVPVEEAAATDLLPISVFRYAERTGEPLLVEDAAHDDRFARDPYVAVLERCSLLVVPIINKGVVRAILMLENRLRKGAFAADRLDAVMLVTAQLTVSLDNAQLYTSLERKVAERTVALEDANRTLQALSQTDALTGLPNRRHFDTMLGAEWRRAGRQANPLSLAMIDIDDFKLYNDRYGHVAGDECLRIVANAFRDGLRSEADVVCRYGGEEFAVLMPATDQATGLIVAERIRVAVTALRQPHRGSGTGIVTVSIGVATYAPGAPTTADELVATADFGLYEAKANGRNQVRSAR
jgi:diguanylate cyclase (GGDEF)-like protein